MLKSQQPKPQTQKKKLTPSSVVAVKPTVQAKPVVSEKKKTVPIDQQVKEIKKFKTNTSKSVSFKPKFTSIFVDQQEEAEETLPVVSLDISKTSVRYSDNDLSYFKTIIVDRIERERAELQYLRTSINVNNSSPNSSDSSADEVAGVFATVANDAFSQASVGDRNYMMNLISRKIKLIKHLEDSLIRIENKTYGICRVTGKLIDKERLKLVPHATLSREAKEGLGNH